MALILPTAFPVVGLGVTSAAVLHIYQMMKVGSARKAAGVAYPNLYATDAEAKADRKKLLFNCAQRAHQNTLETMPFILAMLGYLGIFHPKFSTTCTFLWVIGKYAYTVGYATGDPSKRTNPFSVINYFGLFGLLFGTAGVSAMKTYQYFM